jgi:hypothetical protein
MDKIQITPHMDHQQRIHYWGVLVGYCSTRPNHKIHFLLGELDSLTDEEKADVIEYVQEHVAPVKRSNETKEAWDVIDRRHSTGGRLKG